MSQTYPRPLTSIHQIEPISACNLRCVYCPSKDLEEIRQQPKMNMGLDVFERALHWCKHFEAQGTQGELSLTGIGETLMHPEWREMVRMAREALPGNYLNFSTNGILLDDAACEHLAQYGFRVWVSLHRPEKAGPAMNRAARWGILDGPNASAAISSFDWGGVVDWEVTAPASPCEWLRQGWGNVLVDGRMSTCCLDAAAQGVVGTVWDEPGSLSIKPYSLCEGCHMIVP